MRRFSVVTISAALLIGLGLLAPSSEATLSNTTIPTAGRFQPPLSSLQAIVVKTTYWRSTYATVETWVRASATSSWVRKGTGTGRVGYSGIKITRVQGDGSTPAGKFRILWGFGTGTNPNTRGMGWRRFDSNDYWVGDPLHAPSYNTYQTSRTSGWRTSWAERLADYRTLYQYAWVISFNRPRLGTRPASEPQPILSGPGSGSGIFLHVQGSGATAGCVSIPLSRITSLSAWFDKAKNPIIIIGEDDWLKG
jgi:L,D-peptidoglycan transpeptidase YkuD (ErfK/YbiS/YcfS/YnhG family)